MNSNFNWNPISLSDFESDNNQLPILRNYEFESWIIPFVTPKCQSLLFIITCYCNNMVDLIGSKAALQKLDKISFHARFVQGLLQGLLQIEKKFPLAFPINPFFRCLLKLNVDQKPNSFRRFTKTRHIKSSLVSLQWLHRDKNIPLKTNEMENPSMKIVSFKMLKFATNQFPDFFSCNKAIRNWFARKGHVSHLDRVTAAQKVLKLKTLI